MHRYLLAALLLLAALPVRAALEFSGYLGSTDSIQFLLTDTDTQTTSSPLSIGGVFHGHKIAGFDVIKRVITVERDGEFIELPLKESRVRHGAPTPVIGLQIKLTITPDGAIAFNERPITTQDFAEMIKSHVVSGTLMRLHIYVPDEPATKVRDTLNEIHAFMRKSGGKKWSLQVTGAPTVAAAAPPSAPAGAP